MLRTIVNYASANGWYPAGQQRLADSFSDLCNHGGIRLLLRNDYDGLARPSHVTAPYAFKPHEVERAVVAGARTILWLDASMWLNANPTPIFVHAEEHGAAVWDCEFMLGQWCHDAGLAAMGITRDQAMQIPLVIGGCVCIATGHPKGRALLKYWLEKSRDGVSFQGAWTNENGSCSSDPRCTGHRHDMPSLSYIVHKLGIPLIKKPKWFDYWNDTAPTMPIIWARGM